MGIVLLRVLSPMNKSCSCWPLIWSPFSALTKLLLTACAAAEIPLALVTLSNSIWFYIYFQCTHTHTFAMTSHFQCSVQSLEFFVLSFCHISAKQRLQRGSCYSMQFSVLILHWRQAPHEDSKQCKKSLKFWSVKSLGGYYNVTEYGTRLEVTTKSNRIISSRSQRHCWVRCIMDTKHTE